MKRTVRNGVTFVFLIVGFISLTSSNNADHKTKVHGTHNIGEQGHLLRDRRQAIFADNKDSVVIKVTLIYDNEAYKQLGFGSNAVKDHAKQTEQQLNSLFSPLNISIEVLEVVVWSLYNAFSTTTDDLLQKLTSYRANLAASGDSSYYTHLVSGRKWHYRYNSKYSKMCSPDESVGYSSYSDVRNSAVNIAGAIGESLGMPFDKPQCTCPEPLCLLAGWYRTHAKMASWSNCSIEWWRKAFANTTRFTCLRDEIEEPTTEQPKILEIPAEPELNTGGVVWNTDEEEVTPKKLLENEKDATAQLQTKINERDDIIDALQRRVEDLDARKLAYEQLVARLKAEHEQVVEQHQEKLSKCERARKGPCANQDNGRIPNCSDVLKDEAELVAIISGNNRRGFELVRPRCVVDAI